MKFCSRGVVRVALWNIGGAILGVIAFGTVDPDLGLASLVRSFFIGLAFSVSISSLCYAVLPHLGPYLVRRTSPAAYWAVMIAAMLGLATIGSGIALLALNGFGYVGARELFVALRSSLKISMVVTLAVGISVTMIETMRGRLERATIELRTKERDEAEARRLAAEAHLSSLESRVQPHFLFNTLNSIAALIPQDPAGAEKMTEQLASLLRSSLDAGDGPLTSLQQELRHVRDYLEIERVRFGSRLRYDISVTVDEATIRVPRFALQTLVENSIKYAVAPSRTGAMIAISAQAGARALVLRVQDDGPGFSDQDIPDGHGLALVRERLRMTFGDRARLVLGGRAGAATATIEIDIAWSDS